MKTSIIKNAKPSVGEQFTAQRPKPKIEMTTAPLEIPPRLVTVAVTPETIRLPKAGEHDPHFGMTRSALNELILPTPRNGHKPPVKSFVLRKRGARTGVRLVDYQDLRRYILAHAESGTDKEAAG